MNIDFPNLPAGAVVRLPSNNLGQIEGLATPNEGVQFRARNVVKVDVPNLNAFTVAGGAANDGVTNVAGDCVLLQAQLTAATRGPWIVGTPVAGVAPLTRPSWWQSGTAIKTGTVIVVGGEGQVFANTNWQSMFNGEQTVVDAADPELYPQVVSGRVNLIGGTVTIGSPIRSIRSAVHVSRVVANTTAATVMYAVTNAGADGITIGPGVGTLPGQFVAQACVAGGGLNNADISTICYTVVNQDGQ
jgi:hypothetical protein